MRVLITGSAGFIGSHMKQYLESQGDEIVGLDILDGPQGDALEFFRTDNTRFDLAIHCAAVIGGREGIDGSPLSIAKNLGLDAWYFNWLVRSGTPHAVYYSSSAAYPVDLQNDLAYPRPLNEDDIQLSTTFGVGRPDAMYGWAKLTGEQLAVHARKAGVDVLVLRPFSGYGTDQDPNYPFRAIVDRALRKDDPFDIWGDGEQIRDWVHVDDVVGFTMAALDAGHQGPLNIGTGILTSFNDLAAIVIRQVGGGYNPVIRHLLDKPTGVACRYADTSRMFELYVPTVSLAEGVARALSENSVR